MTTIDLTTLPAPDIADTLDYETILAERKARLIALTPAENRDAITATLALESEPIAILLQESAYRELVLRARINDAARANLIAYATGADLDQLGAFYNLARLPGESDDRYRLRLQLRIAAMAGSGTAEHYRLVALSASTDVVDAAVISPRPGRVDVAIWARTTAEAAATLSAVETALNAADTRMLGVEVVAHIARPKGLNISARIWREPSAPVDLAATLTSALPGIISAYASLGRDLAISWLSARLHVAGVSRVEIITPTADIAIDDDEYITTGVVSLSDQGVAW